jgi:hypothetical protein
VVSDEDIRSILAKAAPILGQRPWGVALGVGSFVTMEFGATQPLRHAEERPHGAWHLWIRYPAWRLEAGDRVLAASEDPRDHLAASLQRLEGQVLRALEVVPPALDTVFAFEGGLRLRLFPMYSDAATESAGEGYDHWLLFTPDDHVLVVGPGSRWKYQLADEP